MPFMTNAEKARLNELMYKQNRTDEEDAEYRRLKDKDVREEVPVGTTTQKVEMELESASVSPSEEPLEDDEIIEKGKRADEREAKQEAKAKKASK